MITTKDLQDPRVRSPGPFCVAQASVGRERCPAEDAVGPDGGMGGFCYHCCYYYRIISVVVVVVVIIIMITMIIIVVFVVDIFICSLFFIYLFCRPMYP